MGERKVLNKYIPSDFDPSLVPRGSKLSKKDGTVPVRMMLPFSVQCDTCNTFLYRGRKFNSKKEAMGGPDGRYLGIQRWRFYIKCTHCSRSVTFLTDPKNADYEMEHGATRNYEVYKDQEKTEENTALQKEEKEKIDPMKALENRVLESQREMADLDNLEEIRAMNRRHVQMMAKSGNTFDSDTKLLLETIDAKKIKPNDAKSLNEHGTTAEDEELIKSIKFGSSAEATSRLDEEEEEFLQARRKRELAAIKEQQSKAPKTKKASATFVPVLKKRRKNPVVALSKPKPAPKTGLSDLLGDYGSGSSSE